MRPCDNPFATERLDSIPYRLVGCSWDDLLERFFSLGLRASIVGPQGSGKTRLLEEFGPRLKRCGLSPLYASAGEGVFPPLARAGLAGAGKESVLLLDSAERLGPLEWLQVLRRARHLGGILITTHRAGRLSVVFECMPSLDLFFEIVEELAGDKTSLSRKELQNIYHKHRGNMRSALLECYDRVQRSS